MVWDPKDQGACGSCWAFSAIGAVEAANAIKSGTLKAFSEQQLVDCDKSSGGNQGCNGGDMDLAFDYVKKNPLMLEDDYPYAGSDNQCNYDASKGVGTVSSYVDVTPNSQKELQSALMTGPASVAIEADQFSFQMYKSGVLTSEDCGTTLDHGVLAVGYGTEDGKDYYLVKNPWGSKWGDKGFIKIGAQADGPGICGI